MCAMNDNNVYNDYYKAIKRDESSVVLNHYPQNYLSSDASVTCQPEVSPRMPPMPQMPTTSSRASNHVTFGTPRTLEMDGPSMTSPNGGRQHHYIRQEVPVKKSSIEVVLSSPTGVPSNGGLASNAYSSQYYSRIIQNQSDAEEKYYYNNFERQYQFCSNPAEITKSLRWIHWRMTLFVFYWIVWFIGLILVIIIVAYRAKV